MVSQKHLSALMWLAHLALRARSWPGVLTTRLWHQSTLQDATTAPEDSLNHNKSAFETFEKGVRRYILALHSTVFLPVEIKLR